MTQRVKPRPPTDEARRETSRTSPPRVGPGLLQAAPRADDLEHVLARMLVDLVLRVPRAVCQHRARTQGRARRVKSARRSAGITCVAAARERDGQHLMERKAGCSQCRARAHAHAHLEALLLDQGARGGAASRSRPSHPVDPRLWRARRRSRVTNRANVATFCELAALRRKIDLQIFPLWACRSARSRPLPLDRAR